MTEGTKPQDVAGWMYEEVQSAHFLYQDTAVVEIGRRFGEEFVYINDAGNFAIAKPVLAAFRKVSKSDVVWDKGERAWRLRIDSDLKSREQP